MENHSENLVNANSVTEYVPSMSRDLGSLFDVLDIASDGTSLLGSSNLSTRYWSGILSVYDSPEHLGNPSRSRTSAEFEGGLSCAKFISPSKVIVALDSGGVSLVDVAVRPGADPNQLASSAEHDDVVTSLSLTSDRTRAATGSKDRSLKIWNTDYLICSHTYRPAHLDEVVSVDIHPEQPDVLASCSEDGQAILWDLRMPRPALAIRRPLVSRPSCVSFLPGRGASLNLLIGTVSGHLLELDVSSPTSPPLLELGAHKRAVRKILRPVVERDSFVVATCADDRAVVVVSVDPAHPQIIYSDERHCDVVQGLAWSHADPSQLYSCGWDRQILTHKIAL